MVEEQSSQPITKATTKPGAVVEWRGGREGDARHSLVRSEGEPCSEALSSWAWT